MPLHRVRVLSSAFAEYIEKYVNSLPDGQEWLFVGQGRKKPISIPMAERIFQTWAIESGIDYGNWVSWHSLRHGMASKIAELGGENMTVTALTIKETLRHTTTRSAEPYLHLAENAEIKDRISADIGDISI